MPPRSRTSSKRIRRLRARCPTKRAEEGRPDRGHEEARDHRKRGPARWLGLAPSSRAVIGLLYDATELGAHAKELVADGTAVRLER
jgi:hypothetical protein